MRYTIQPKYLTHPTRKSTTLMAVAHFDGKRVKKSTAISIPLAAWDQESKRLKKQCNGWAPGHAIQAHDALRKLEQLLSQRSLQVMADEDRDLNREEFLEIVEAFTMGASDANRTDEADASQPDLLEYLDEFIPTAIKRRNKHAKGDAERITPKTLQQYTQLQPLLTLFRNWSGRSLDMRNVDVEWHDAFLEWGANVELLGPATLGKHIKSLKRLFYYAKKDGYDVHPDPLANEDFDKPRQPKNEVQYLNRDELKRIKALDLSSKPLLSLERDRLIIGCWTGLRVSDLGRLSLDMIKENADGDKFITITTQKTRKKVVIPILKDVQEVLDRRGCFPRFRTEQSFNAAIKRICELAEINNTVKAEKQGKVFVDRKDDNGRRYKEEVKRKVPGTFKKYELISTHSCRRSFASNWYGSMPNQVIMGITGHSKEEDFLRYIGVTEEENAERFLRFWRDQRRRNGLE